VPKASVEAGEANTSAIISLLAGVAQLVEQRIRNAKVEGSTPSTGTLPIPRRMLRKPLLAFPLALAVFAFASAAVAENDAAAPVYRCKAPGGAVTYQDYPCKGGVAVDIKPDAADPAAIQRLRQAQARFDRSLAQRRAAEEMATRREPPERRRAIAPAPDFGDDVQTPDVRDVPGYLLYGPVPPAKFERRNRRIEHRVIAPEHRVVPGVIRRLRPT
jgi:hypothetical protein